MHRWSRFQIAGAAGFVVAASLALWLTASRDREVAITATMIAIAAGCFVFLALLTKIVRGTETLTYYHHEILILAACAFAVHAMGRPTLPYLDVAALSLGLFLAWFVIWFSLMIIGMIPVLGWLTILLWPIVGIAMLVIWLIALVKAFNNESWKLPVIGDIAEKQSATL